MTVSFWPILKLLGIRRSTSTMNWSDHQLIQTALIVYVDRNERFYIALRTHQTNVKGARCLETAGLICYNMLDELVWNVLSEIHTKHNLKKQSTQCFRNPFLLLWQNWFSFGKGLEVLLGTSQHFSSCRRTGNMVWVASGLQRAWILCLRLSK